VKFCQFLTWKIWFLPMRRIFHEKMDPNSADIEFYFSNCQICMISSRLIVNIEQFYFLLLSYLVRYQIWLNYFENNCHFGNITKSLKAPWFKRSGVQAKFLPALCYWAWRGVFANSLSVGSAVVCPKKNKIKKKKKSLKETLHPSGSGFQHENLSNTCQSRPRKSPQKQCFFCQMAQFGEIFF
jgi:hypothetical protein